MPIMNAVTLHGLHVLVNAVDFFAWFSACGLLMARAGLVPAAAFQVPGAERAWRRSLLADVVVLAITGCALFVVRTGEMSGLPLAQAMGLLPEVILHTHFGVVWAMHLALLGLLAASMFLPPGVGLSASACIAAVLAFTYSATSHAGDQGDFTFSELNDWAHVIAASLWSGGIIATLFFAYPLLKNRRDLLAQAVFHLSRVSAAALAGVIATGMFNAIVRLRDLDELLITDYGRTLAIKVGTVGIMALLGAYGRFFIVPRLRAARTDRDADIRLRRMAYTLTLDVVLIAVVLTAAVMLIQGMPPSSMHGMGSMPR